MGSGLAFFIFLSHLCSSFPSPLSCYLPSLLFLFPLSLEGRGLRVRVKIITNLAKGKGVYLSSVLFPYLNKFLSTVAYLVCKDIRLSYRLALHWKRLFDNLGETS